MADQLSEQFTQLNIMDFEDKVTDNNLNAEATFYNRVGDIFYQNHFNLKILFRSNYSRSLMSFFFVFGFDEDTNQKLARCVEEAYFLKKRFSLKAQSVC